jgi:hypothetical protein
MTTPTKAIETLKQIWQSEPETFEFYASPILQGAHNRKLRIEIYQTLYGVKVKKITPYECMRYVEAKFRQHSLF